MRGHVPILLAALALGCRAPDNVFRIQPELAPKFDLLYQGDVGAGKGRLSFELSTEAWSETLTFGGVTLAPGRVYEVRVEDAFGPNRAVVLTDPGGQDWTVAFEPYAPAPNPPSPMYRGLAFVPESAGSGAIWLHIDVGDHADRGIRIRVSST